jgi:hypothetical protein
MTSWKDNLTKEQLERIRLAEIEAIKILDRNKPLIKKIKKMRKRFNKKWSENI